MPKVVVIGGGMAGVACADELGAHDIDVVLVDRNNYLQFQPLLYQVASSQLPAEDIARPLTVVFDERPSVSVRQTVVTAIDFASREVSTADGSLGPADYLVLPPDRNRTSSEFRAPTGIPSRCIRSLTRNGCGCICTNSCECTAIRIRRPVR